MKYSNKLPLEPSSSGSFSLLCCLDCRVCLFLMQCSPSNSPLPVSISDVKQLCCCRDSGQPDVFFTLSYQSDDGPTSIRVQLNKLLFSLYGSQRTFASLFALLTYYTSSGCKLTVPYRKQRPERLKQMCRRAFIHAFGAESISTLPRLNMQVKGYIYAYPYSI